MEPSNEESEPMIKKLNNDDAIDRLNYRYTSLFLAFLILFFGFKYYVNAPPIKCWLPDEIEESSKKYVENYCYFENTYFVSGAENEEFPLELLEGERYEQSYYRWIPTLLFFQLGLFLLPKYFWNILSWKTGLSVTRIINRSSYCSAKCGETSEASYAARHIRCVIVFNSRLHSCCGVNSLSFKYFLFKLLNFFNTYIQLLMLIRFLPSSTFGGFGLVRDLMNGNNWKLTGQFPRVTLCDFMFRNETTTLPIHATVKCLLTNNHFNEWLYIILWFWIFALNFLNFINLFYWLFTSAKNEWKIYFIQRQLDFAGKNCSEVEVLEFIKKWIKMDGITALRLINGNCGVSISSKIVAAMYDEYQLKTAKEVGNAFSRKRQNLTAV
uniref:Innexin n=1 Tax=Panagrolaimus sp. ES5 TaxID=591445 RepID=A0AC34FCA8_9BILA